MSQTALHLVDHRNRPLRAQRRQPDRGMIIDLFAGGGGASEGLEAAIGRRVDVALNHSPVALATHRRNHPRTRHVEADVFKANPRELTRGRRVWILWASPDCRDFSVAKGGKPRSASVRSLAWAVIDWARDTQPDLIFLENVAEFEGWGPLDENGKRIRARVGETFRRWKRDLEALGYVVEHRVLTASHYGAPTSRKRFFLVARRDGQPIRWPSPTHGPGLLPFHAAAEIIDWGIPVPSIFGRKKPLAENTLARIAAGIRRFVLEHPHPFIVGDVAPVLVQTGYGERDGQRPRFLDIQQPLGTVVATGQKHALCAAFLAKHFGDPRRKSGGGVVIGDDLRKPLGTITARDHHSLVTADLTPAGDRPDRRDQVRAFLTTYYGSNGTNADVGQALDEPLRTITTRDRFGLVTVNGVDHDITDIGLRMLVPAELLRAQFGRFASTYDLSAAETIKDQVQLVGNSVCPEAAEALVAANVSPIGAREAA
jgi:DNA (cytosine-5)-methyltransferase 1